jgi:hypothetical protein
MEEVVRLHTFRVVEGHRQYLVEWANSWTDGYRVKLEPRVHDIGTIPKRGDPRWEVTEVFEQKQRDAGTTVYSVKWGKTWEPASYLIPKGSHISGLIADFTMKN